ncbi:MAG: hypothetical protein R2699_10120 [Acidimicrobiales bacterium]
MRHGSRCTEPLATLDEVTSAYDDLGQERDAVPAARRKVEHRHGTSPGDPTGEGRFP